MSTTTTAPTPRVEEQFVVGRPHFLDALRGWAPINRRCGGGSCPIEVLATLDGGVTWTVRTRQPVDIGGPLGPGIQPTIQFATAEIGWLYNVTDPPDSTGRLYRTDDGGRTWAAAAVDGVVSDLFAHGRQVWRLDRRCPAADAPCTFRVLRSADTGVHWAAPAVAPDIAASVEGFATPTEQVAYVLSNPSQRSQGDYDLPPAAPILVRTGDGGRSWVRLRPPCTGAAGEELTTSPLPDDVWFVCHDIPASGSMAPKHLYRSSDGGRHWSAAIDAVPVGAGGEIMAGSPTRACKTGHGTIGCTRDGGRHWFFPVPSGTDDGGGGVEAVEFVDPLHAWEIGADHRGGGRYNILWRTTDGGETWTPSVIDPGAARLWIIPGSGPANTTVTIIGQNCQPPGQPTVEVVAGPTPDEARPIATAAVDRRGRFSVAYQIPVGASKDLHVYTRTPSCDDEYFVVP